MYSTRGHQEVVNAYHANVLRQDQEDERAFMARILPDSTTSGAVLTVAQRDYLARWHAQGWWSYDGMSLSNGHLTEIGRSALHERLGGRI
jgi:hypothetical protein